MSLLQVINNNYSTPSSDSFSLLNYIPAISFGFVVLSYFIEKMIARRSKRKEIVRQWYLQSLLEPSLGPLNELFESIKQLTYRHVGIFDVKSDTLSNKEFLRYKARINADFQTLKNTFYLEHLVPIYHNYPKIAEDAAKFLLLVQDSFIRLFGQAKLNKIDFEHFMNDLYIEKGKLLAVLRKPLH